MKLISFLTLSILASFAFAIALTQRTVAPNLPAATGIKPGVYDFKIDLVGVGYLAICLTPAQNGEFTVGGTLDSEATMSSQSDPYGKVIGTLSKAGILRANVVVNGKKIALDGKWNSAANTLSITWTMKGSKTYQGQLRAKPQAGQYKAEQADFRFNLETTNVAGQMKISGLYGEAMAVPVVFHGTYFVNRNFFTAFGTYYKGESKMSATIDGRMPDADFFRVRLKRTASSGHVRDQWYEAIRIGTVLAGLTTPPKKPMSLMGELKGTLKVNKSAVEIGETVQLSVEYKLEKRDAETVSESIALYGPSGKLESRSDEEKEITQYSPRKVTFDIRCAKDGAYTIKSNVRGKESSQWEASVSFTVKPPKDKIKPKETGSNVGNSIPNGSWGLVKKLVGKAPADTPTYYGSVLSSSISEGSLTFADTPAKEGVLTSANVSMTWDNPPSTLKPGQVLELSISANARVSEKDYNLMNLSVWYVFRGFEVIEQQNAFVGHAEKGFIASGSGKFKVKVPEKSTSGELFIWQGQTGLAYGTGGNFYPCQYWYQWNAKPIDNGKPKSDPVKDQGETEEPDEPPFKVTTMVQTSVPEDEDKQIIATLDPESITLYAGEPSKIVDISISGFRTNTSDRVEVVFPQATDNQASLPGQIVVGSGGTWSYDPANMARPKHTDGYFFSARSTAPDGTEKITIIVRQKGAKEAKLTLEVVVVGKPTTPDGPIGIDLSGDWTSNTAWGTLTLDQIDDKVDGSFANGKSMLTGVLKGETMTFKIQAYFGSSGAGQLTVSTDGKYLNGYFTLDDDASKTKNLLKFTRKVPLRNLRKSTLIASLPVLQYH